MRQEISNPAGQSPQEREPIAQSNDNTPKYNLFGPEFKAQPHSIYAKMRQEDPIYCRPAFHSERVMQELAQLDEDSPVLDPVMDLMNNHMLNLDVPDHTRLRGLVNKAFTARVVSQMEERVQRLADELLNKVQARQQMDLVEQYAYPLPSLALLNGQPQPQKV